jgi:hypothetical protein
MIFTSTLNYFLLESKDYVVRLPQDFDPLLYAIELQPDIYNNTTPDDFTLSGSVTIQMNCLIDTSVITLNIDGLSIDGKRFICCLRTQKHLSRVMTKPT